VNAAQIKIIALGVLALLLVWAATALLPSGTDRATADFRLPVVAPDSVEAITVTTRAETVRVSRATPGGWSVNGFAASSTAVEVLFAVIGDSTRPELVARSAASFVRLGVDTAAARRLTVSGRGGTMLDLLVADRGPEAGGVYIRTPDDSAVYTGSNRLGSVVRRTADDWRDRVIATVVTDSVRRVDVERGARRYTLQRRDSVWRFAGGATADSAGVARFLDRFRPANASGFPSRAQLDTAFRGRHERRVTFFGRTDTALVVLDFDSTANGFWVRQSPDGPVYRVSLWEADQLTPADSTLRRRKT